jgi:TonB family protein
MVHGTSTYFVERARFERRVSLMMATVAVAFLGAQLLLMLPPVRASLARHVPVLDPRRWGFEGPNQYVRRIVLQSSGSGGSVRTPIVTYVPHQALKGGHSAKRTSTSPSAVPEIRRPRVGPGDSPADLLTRARSLYREAPVVQSEDLVIEHLVRPVYPEGARDHNIEGRVAVVALVDTFGTVVNVDLLKGSGESQLDRAAAAAVWKCRFRPYSERGRLQEVYAVFRFAFRIY